MGIIRSKRREAKASLSAALMSQLAGQPCVRRRRRPRLTGAALNYAFAFSGWPAGRRVAPRLSRCPRVQSRRSSSGLLYALVKGML